MKYNGFLIFLLGVMLILTGEVFSQNVTTLAGNGMAGFVNGIGVAASFNSPRGVTVDGAGNVYVADRFNNAIRKIDPAGVVTTLAGSAASGNTDATGVLARFNDPTGITVDALGNVYVGDRFNHRIRRITPAGVVTTIAGSSAGFADNVGAAAQFDNPIGVAVNPAGTILYVADYNNHRIRQVIIATGVVTTLAGSGTGGFADGFGVAAQFNLPTSVGVESSTGNVYVADSQNFRIRKINIGTGEVTTIAGSAISGTADGTGAAAQFINPIGCSIDGSGNIYTTDVSRVRRITPDGVVTRIAGSTPGFADGAPLTAQFNVTRGVAIDNQGNIYVGDEGNNRIRKIIPAPTITNLSPVTAASGATVTITGTNFTDATAVNFGGVAAASFTVVNASTITAVVASGGASGAVSVTAPGGTANSVMPFTFIPFPTITNFSPSGHSVGGLITITGTNFTGATAVNFGGVAASSFVVVNATTINAVVAGAGASGAVLVTTPGGTTGAPTAFTFFPSPSITTFSPSATSSGATITITGTNFIGATAVSFGGVAAASFMVVNASTITAVVAPGGASGTISVTTPGGTVVSAMSNTFTPPPTISSFFPSTASSGATVTITGTNFTGASAVNFGGVAATSFMVLNPTTIVAVVASGGASGAVTVTTPGGTTGAAGAFTFIAPPTITNFIPTSSLPGVIITINGSGFNAASAVSFGGVPATNFTVVNSNQITAVVALGGATGSVQVTTPGGVASSGGFIFLAPPSITSFSPTVAGPGVAVTINGVNLGGTNSVLFGGIPATSIVVNSPTSVTAVVNNGASGNISLTTPSGATFASGFTYVPAPVVASFSPLNAGAGSVITITGANFIGATSVTLGGIPAASFVVSSSTEIKAVVPVGGASGSITVSTLGGSGSRMGFTFIPPPTITSFSPTIAATGMIMNISGTNFSGTTALRLGGVTAASYTVVSPTFISVVIGTGASGSVSVTTPGGVASQPGFTFIPPTKVTNFTPMSAAKGEIVVVTGISFVGVPQVSFGGSKAASYTVISSTEIHAVVGDGTSGSVTVSTHVGTDSKPGFTFIPPPEITDFSPVRAPKGALVVITGVNFNGTTDVRFGGVPAESYTVISPTEIRAIVGEGLSGSVSVISTGGTVSKPGFTFIPSPTITSFTINPALTVATIIIRGTNFVDVSEVSFGGVTASSYTVISPTEIRAVVGAGAVGNISVTTPGGTATKVGFTFIPLPTITRFTPINAPSGAEVTIVGSNFTGTTEVRFGGVIAARYTVISPTEIRAIVGTGASGSVVVTTTVGTVSRAGFTFIPPPTITNFSPPSTAMGVPVIITGTNFIGVSSVQFGGVTASSYVVVSPTEIRAIVGTGASGSVSITSSGGTVSKAGYTYYAPPSITSFTPTSAPSGGIVIIRGTNFIGVSSVRFGGLPAASFTVISPNEIRAVVGEGASGIVAIVALGGEAQTDNIVGKTFVFLTPLTGGVPIVPVPVVTGFTPTATGKDRIVTIIGENFINVTSVKFGGTEAARFTVVSRSLITAVVSVGTSGEVSVTNSGGTGALSGFTFVPAPLIASFTPSEGPIGTTIIIVGEHFSRVNRVLVGGVSVPFVVNDAKKITLTVPLSGVVTGNIMLISAGGIGVSARQFTYQPLPSITTATFVQSRQGMVLKISGRNFLNATTVTIGQTTVPFTVITQSDVTASIPVGVSPSDIVRVFTPGGMAISSGQPSLPVITSITPDRGTSGTQLIITGQLLSSVTQVSIGGVVVPFTILSSGQVAITIPQSEVSGAIGLLTPFGLVTTTSTFTFLGQHPSIFSFSPSSGDIGTEIRITGENLGSPLLVYVGGMSVSFRSVGSRELILTIPSSGGTSGSIVVVSSTGIAISDETFTFTPGGIMPSVVSVPLQARAFPNPASELVTISYLADKVLKNVTIRIFDIRGRVLAILPQGAQDIGERLVDIPVNNFSIGMYLVSIEMDNRQLYTYFVISR